MHLVPTLYCPFASYNDPDLEKEVENHTLKFLTDFKLVGPDKLEFYRSQRFPAMITRSYPYGDAETLMAWCDLNTLLFLVDDDLDERFDIRDESSLSIFTDKFVKILETNECPYEDPVYLAFHDFWLRIIPLSSERWRRTFIQNVKDMWAGGLWQFQHIVTGSKPSLHEYCELRQYLGAAHLATDSLEITAQVPLPDTVFADADVMELTILARNIICFANDLFSLGKEMQQSHMGAEFNLVTIIAREQNVDIDEAIKRAAAFHDQCVADFVGKRDNVYKFGEYNLHLQKYVRSLEYLMQGNVDWSTQVTSRYPHLYGEAKQAG